MLCTLHIENYALIERLDLSFADGFSVITGETGAGKSILLGALSLILGQRADNRVIQDGAEKCVTEATFHIGRYRLQPFFEVNDLEYDPETCLIRRELYANGKSRAFINDSPVPLSILKELSGKLMDIHSQHQNLLLGDESYQLNVIDDLAGHPELLQQYRRQFNHHRDLRQQLRNLEDEARKAGEEEDYLRFQMDQLQEANLKEGEQEELEAEWERLTHAGDIQSGLGKMVHALDDEEHGVNQNLKTALNQEELLERLFPRLKEAGERIRSCYLDLKDLTRELEVMLNDAEADPKRMEQIGERLNQLFTLQQKHRVKTVDELMALQEDFAGKLQLIASFEDRLRQLNQQCTEAEAETLRLAEDLTTSRKKVLLVVGDRLTGQLRQLGMPKAVLTVDWTLKTPAPDGQDVITFLFSANPQIRPQPIDRIASGGEISRIMLCIKSMIAEYVSMPTLLFDEIDTGVSGEIAHKMGEIMKEIASNRQVLCITHLPQIAAKGQAHYKVLKSESHGRSLTEVLSLDAEARLTEIALMLSGANLTDAALSNARQLMLENTSYQSNE